MNSEKESPIVEIRSAEAAARWVGRHVQIGWRGYRDQVDHWYDYKLGVLTHTTVNRGKNLRVHLDSGQWLPYTHGDPVIIRLLDGAAHPRPEGDGWVWCETSEQVIAQFRGIFVDISAAAEAKMGPACGLPARTEINVCPSHTVGRGVMYSQSTHGGRSERICVDDHGGAWIRLAMSEPAKTPEREAADSLEIETVAADDAAQAASAYAASLHRELRNARREADEADERDSRTKADALWVLPDGWEWRRKAEWGQLRAFGLLNHAVWVACGDVCAQDVDDDSWAWAPIEVIETVIARYRAENPE